MTTHGARFVRGWIVAVFSTFVAALSHTLGGADAPGWPVVVVSLAVAGMVCVAFSGRTLSFWRSTTSVLISQIIFHGLFSLGAAGGGARGADAIVASATGQHVALASLIDPLVLSSSAHPAHSGATMWLAHLGAAIVTVTALRYGERAFWGLLENVCLGIRTLFVRNLLAVPVAAPRRIGHDAPVLTPHNLVLVLSPMRRRGPPSVLLAA